MRQRSGYLPNMKSRDDRPNEGVNNTSDPDPQLATKLPPGRATVSTGTTSKMVDPYAIYKDPLGLRPHVVDIDTLTRWNKTEVPAYEEVKDNSTQTVPFPYREDVNAKVVLWPGDVTRLGVTAMAHPTNEAMNDRNPLSDLMYEIGGPELRQEVKHLRGCKTGEAKLTKGHQLPARYVIHTVGPRYNLKYHTAAESALFCCYRNVMQIVKENNLSSIAFPCIHSQRRGYPVEEGAHIALRTVRRFLEKHGDSVDTVIFAVMEHEESRELETWRVLCSRELEVYIQLLPLYFPRSEKEAQYAIGFIPEDVGNEDGEPVIPERQIRIMDKPTFKSLKTTELNGTAEGMESSVNINEQFNTSVAVGQHAFAHMEGDHDSQRQEVLRGRTSSEALALEQQRRYDRWLKRARKEDLSDIARLRCIYHTGVDKMGRPVIVFIGKNFPATTIDLEKALLYFIHILDPIVNKDYVVVYFHTLTTGENLPQQAFLKSVYNLVDHKYKKHLKAFYIIHPTFWSRLMTWFFTTFTVSGIKNKVHGLPGIQYLYDKINPDEMDIPSFILDYDMQKNGKDYYTPRMTEEANDL
ncbi:protein GDAP2 homolog isoform X2 [Lingula anatina]|uniref:Protein GDAP2 homolog isoform X2 n=1 Tax=Lingula anatina TaxID=7574 RepID=A0A1S3KGY2_LINAN|nr:protein GDAP2 homolog isoform X2 [Lingula anatina]|eukprot:XP_013421898.1 protein GDAP2 homolog isoform X2 [Lingula anatina]